MTESKRSHGGRARVSAVLIFVAMSVIAWALMRQSKFPVETHHNVYVWSRIPGTQASWWISSDEGDRSLPFSRWDCCPDFPCDTVIWPGYVMATFRYEERGVCKSIRADGLGAWWERDADGNVKEW